MQRLTAVSILGDRSRVGPLAVGAFGCLLALILGVSAASHRGTLLIGAVGGAFLCVAAIAIYVRDPVLAFIWLWLFEIFNAPVSASAGYFSPTGEAIRQADELLVVLFVCLTLWRTARSSARMPPVWLVLPTVGVAACGLLGAVSHDVSLKVTLVGAWLGLKLWTMLIITFLLPWKPGDVSRVYKVLTRMGLFVAALGLADYLTHAAISRALHTSIYRYESESLRGEAVHSIFPHPGEYSLFMSLLFAFTFARFAAKRNRSDLILALCFAGSVMLSLRLKGFLSLAAVVAIVALARGSANNRGAALIVAIGALLLIGVYSVEGNVIAKQVATYTTSEGSARAKLYTTSTRIAADNFPLGAGFGRFATYQSRLTYSPVYQEYGLNNVWGLSKKFPNFIDDTSWPGVIGETGYGGFAIYLVGICLLILAILRRMKAVAPDSRWVPLAALCAIAALLVDSLGDPTLFDWLAVTGFALIVGPALVATRVSRVPSTVRQAQLPGVLTARA